MQGLAEPNPPLEEPFPGLCIGIVDVVQSHPGPELTNTAGDPVCVVVQLGVLRQGDHITLGCSGEASQVEALTTHDDVEATTYVQLIGLAQLAYAGHGLLDTLEQPPL